MLTIGGVHVEDIVSVADVTFLIICDGIGGRYGNVPSRISTFHAVGIVCYVVRLS